MVPSGDIGDIGLGTFGLQFQNISGSELTERSKQQPLSTCTHTLNSSSLLFL